MEMKKYQFRYIYKCKDYEFGEMDFLGDEVAVMCAMSLLHNDSTLQEIGIYEITNVLDACNVRPVAIIFNA